MGSQDVSTAAKAVLSEVEQYLVNNLIELERTGASGRTCHHAGFLVVLMQQVARSPPSCSTVFVIPEQVPLPCNSVKDASVGGARP